MLFKEIHMDKKPYVITISHQLGSGGAFLGEQLAERLAIPFLDRDIIKEVARQLDLAETDLTNREERLSSFWQNFTRMAILTDPTVGLSAQAYTLSDQDLFKLECTTIQNIAEKGSAIFLGRCGWYVLRSHPRHIKILVTADHAARIQRLAELYNFSEAQAAEAIKTNDQEREDYIRTFTKQHWLDACHYDLCVNTSTIGLNNTLDLVEKYVQDIIMSWSV
jgi:CMP/dCMP kinase